MKNTFPPEIWYCIISYISIEEAKNLLAINYLSVVVKSIIYYSIEIGNYKVHIQGFSDIRKKKSNILNLSVVDFIGLLKSPDRRYVKQLYLEGTEENSIIAIKRALRDVNDPFYYNIEVFAIYNDIRSEDLILTVPNLKSLIAGRASMRKANNPNVPVSVELLAVSNIFLLKALESYVNLQVLYIDNYAVTWTPSNWTCQFSSLKKLIIKGEFYVPSVYWTQLKFLEDATNLEEITLNAKQSRLDNHIIDLGYLVPKLRKFDVDYYKMYSISNFNFPGSLEDLKVNVDFLIDQSINIPIYLKTLDVSAPLSAHKFQPPPSSAPMSSETDLDTHVMNLPLCIENFSWEPKQMTSGAAISLEQFHTMKKLTFKKTDFSFHPLREFPPNLELLELTNCYIGQFRKLTLPNYIKELDISNSCVISDFDRHIRFPESVEVLTCHGIKLRWIRSTFRFPDNLKILNMGRNRIEAIRCGLPLSLTICDIRHNTFPKLNVSHLERIGLIFIKNNIPEARRLFL